VEVTLLRTILAVACFIFGSALLIPVSLWLWKFLAARLASPEIPYLPDPMETYVLYFDGRPISDVTVLTMATVVGAILLVAGLRMVR
jgi:hypothetical protein